MVCVSLFVYGAIFLMYQVGGRCVGIDTGNDGYQAYQHVHEKKPGADVIAFCQPSRLLPRCGDLSSYSDLMFCRPVISLDMSKYRYL